MSRESDEGFVDRPPIRCGFRGLIAGVLVAIFAATAAGCCSFPVAEETIKDAISVNAGHANSASLSPDARAVAQDNGDLLWQVLFNIGGVDEVPDDVQDRRDARKADK